MGGAGGSARACMRACGNSGQSGLGLRAPAEAASRRMVQRSRRPRLVEGGAGSPEGAPARHPLRRARRRRGRRGAATRALARRAQVRRRACVVMHSRSTNRCPWRRSGSRVPSGRSRWRCQDLSGQVRCPTVRSIQILLASTQVKLSILPLEQSIRQTN